MQHAIFGQNLANTRQIKFYFSDHEADLPCQERNVESRNCCLHWIWDKFSSSICCHCWCWGRLRLSCRQSGQSIAHDRGRNAPEFFSLSQGDFFELVSKAWPPLYAISSNFLNSSNKIQKVKYTNYWSLWRKFKQISRNKLGYQENRRWSGYKELVEEKV